MKKLKVKICPKCRKATEMMLVLGGKLGPIYECKKCGYRGSIFPVAEIKINTDRTNKRKK